MNLVLLCLWEIYAVFWLCLRTRAWSKVQASLVKVWPLGLELRVVYPDTWPIILPAGWDYPLITHEHSLKFWNPMAPQRKYTGTLPHVGNGQGPGEPLMYLEQERKWAWCVTEEKHNAYTGGAEGHLMLGKYKRQKEQTSNGKWRRPVQADLGWFRERKKHAKCGLRDSECLRSRADYEVHSTISNTSDYGLEEAQEERTLTESLTPWTP